jgi:hypothetical protein
MHNDCRKVLFDDLIKLDLPKDDYAVFGSGPLIVRGIIPASNDLDVVCRGAAWEKVKTIGTLQYNDDYDVEIVTLFDGRVTFGNKWGIGNFDVDDLIDGAEYIYELPFVRLEHVVEYKLIRVSAKDLSHIDALKRLLRK